MARRLTEAEKGKHHLHDEPKRSIRKIKAPQLDNSALIKDNERTLIGRLTNPQEQKMWALIPSLPRKWNLRGRVVGSDLGNNCFQFRFEMEEDLRRVLENRPYHFCYWMVILQRWEPVISSTFPSVIPFWIRIKGLPLHFWHDDMVRRVGQDLGTLVTHELTKTTARVRVLIDGLKPLIKEAIVEFDTGEESLITLEYEKLESHCSYCYSLLHHRSRCSLIDQEETSKTPSKAPIEELRYLDSEPLATQKVHTQSQDREPLRNPPMMRDSRHQKQDSTRSFQERVDRHGIPFGERVSTKQTRVPPPVRKSGSEALTTTSWRRKAPLEDATESSRQSYPNDKTLGEGLRDHDREQTAPNNTEVWRPKQSSRGREDREAPKLPSLETVMEDLHETTRQYLSVSDPVEAAARRQRVLLSDARGEMEQTALAIIDSERSKYGTTNRDLSSNSNPATPPPPDLVPSLQRILFHDPSISLSPQGPQEENLREDVRPSSATPELNQPDQGAVTGEQARLKSIIVSPQAASEDEVRVLPPANNQREHSINENQATNKRKGPTASRVNSPRTTPNILRGASSKKRKLSQMQRSPAVNKKTGAKHLAKGSTRAGPSSSRTANPSAAPNPPINLIPARNKRPDFQVPPPQVP